jgi:hypothetical protein
MKERYLVGCTGAIEDETHFLPGCKAYINIKEKKHVLKDHA